MMGVVIINKIKKILSVGDVHFNYATPESRIDNYRDTCIKKIRQVRGICEKEGYKVVVMTGDLFTHNRQPLEYINKVISEFIKFKELGIDVYTISGNHDLSYNRMDYLDRSPLGNMIYSGVVKHLDEIDIETKEGYKVYLKGFDYPEELDSINKDGIKICVAHRYFENYNEDYITKEDIEKLGYHIYILGHDHVSYKPQRVGNRYLIRPGSLTRGTSHNYQLERDVVVDGIVFNGSKDRPKLTLKRHKLDIRPAKQVFTDKVFEEDDDLDNNYDLVEGIGELLDKMSAEGEETSVYNVIDEMDLDKSVKERVELYLSNKGMLRVNKGE